MRENNSENRIDDSVKSPSIIRVVLLVIAGCLIYGIMQGVHDNYGIMMKALVPETGISYQNISFVIGVGAFLYGLVQPFFGMLALRKSNTFVMMIGIAMMVVGLVVTPFCRHFITLLIFFGIILPSGTGAVSFGIVMGAITPLIGEKRAAQVSGIVQSSAGIGDALMSPGLQGLITWNGIAFSMSSFAILMSINIPVVIWIGLKSRVLDQNRINGNGLKDVEKHRAHDEAIDDRQTDPNKETIDRSIAKGQNDQSCEADDVKDADVSGKVPGDEHETLIGIAKEAFSSPACRRIFMGFSTCGFNMSIIESHLFSQYVSWGIPETAASLVMTVYGIMTMLGAVATGFLGTKFKKKNVLGSVYAIRVLISISILMVPQTLPFALILTGLLGATGDSTVPPTIGIITHEFGSRRLAVIYGIALIGHQVGAFASAWFGGFCVENFGSYTPLWIANMCLCAFAAAASYSIRLEDRAF